MKSSVSMLIPILIIWCFLSIPPALAQQQIDNLTISGQYGPVVHLSAGSPSGGGGLTASIVNSSTGANSSGSPLDVETFSFNVDFGDLARGDGNPVAGTIGLRLRSNTAFRLVGSVLNFSAGPLIYQGKELPAGDRGSFVRFWLGNVSGGSNGNANAVSLNGAAVTGMKLSDLSRGPVGTNSTLLVTGSAVSQSGGVVTPNNGVDIPVYVSVPTGYELGPGRGNAKASFSFSLQFGVFAAQ